MARPTRRSGRSGQRERIRQRAREIQDANAGELIVSLWKLTKALVLLILTVVTLLPWLATNRIEKIRVKFPNWHQNRRQRTKARYRLTRGKAKGLWQLLKQGGKAAWSNLWQFLKGKLMTIDTKRKVRYQRTLRDVVVVSSLWGAHYYAEQGGYSPLGFATTWWSVYVLAGWLALRHFNRWADDHKHTFKGLRLGPFEWEFFRWGVSILAGLLLSGLLWLGVEVLVATSVLNDSVPLWTMAPLALIFALYFAENEAGGEVVEDVPGTKFGALKTFLGAPFPYGGIIATSGKYRWTGKRLGLGRTTRVVDNWTDENGFVRLGDVQIKIWNRAPMVTGEKGDPLLSNVAKNRAPVQATFLLELRHNNLRLGLDSEDPTLSVADRARQAARHAFEIFNDTDLTSVHKFLGKIVQGYQVVTSFIPKRFEEHKAGAILRDKSGEPMIRLVKHGDNPTKTVQKFRDEIETKANTKMANLVKDEVNLENGRTVPGHHVHMSRVDETIDGAVFAVGSEVVRITFGDMILSEPVSEAAKQLSAEADERAARLASAQANREARKLLMPTQTERANPELWQLTTMLEAAADDKRGNIRVVFVPGNGNSLASAAVAGASQLTGANS